MGELRAEGPTHHGCCVEELSGEEGAASENSVVDLADSAYCVGAWAVRSKMSWRRKRRRELRC
jgi:hypothetical protein